MKYLLYIPLVLVCYAIGSLSMAYFMGRLHGINLKEKGSGNLGATNAVIVMGWKEGIITGLFDISKAFVCVFFANMILGNVLPFVSSTAAVSVILGHIFPFYLKFKGGKGLSCLIGVTAGFDWRLFIGAALFVIAMIFITKYVALATVALAVVAPIAIGLLEKSLPAALILFIASAVIIIKHTDNIRRIINKTETSLRTFSSGMAKDEKSGDGDGSGDKDGEDKNA